MAGTNAAAVKARLVGTSGVLAGLSGITNVVDVKYQLPLADIPKEIIYGGGVGGSVNLAAMRGGGRIRREEDLNVLLGIRVYQTGNRTAEVTDTRAVAISTIIEDYIAANPTLGGSPDGLKLAWVQAVELDGYVVDQASWSQVTLTIAVKSLLT